MAVESINKYDNFFENDGIDEIYLPNVDATKLKLLLRQKFNKARENLKDKEKPLSYEEWDFYRLLLKKCLQLKIIEIEYAYYFINLLLKSVVFFKFDDERQYNFSKLMLQQLSNKLEQEIFNKGKSRGEFETRNIDRETITIEQLSEVERQILKNYMESLIISRNNLINNMNNIRKFADINGYVDYEEWDVCRNDLIRAINLGQLIDEETSYYLKLLIHIRVNFLSLEEEMNYEEGLAFLNRVMALRKRKL